MDWTEELDRKVEYWKRRLGVWRVPLGVLLLLIAFVCVITPLTPGSLAALLIGLELLNIRKRFFAWLTEKGKKFLKDKAE